MLSKPEMALPEKALAKDLEQRLDLLKADGRCEWFKEVRMKCFTHTLREQADILRVDYAVRLDGNLIGFEVKKSPEKASDLGRSMLQCLQYAHGTIAASTADRINPDWIGSPLWGVFLVTSSEGVSNYTLAHGRAAHRLFGPANVGFFIRDCRHATCFELRLCGSRAWSKEWGWNRSLVNKTSRSGNGQFRAVNADTFVFPSIDDEDPARDGVGFEHAPSREEQW